MTLKGSPQQGSSSSSIGGVTLQDLQRIPTHFFTKGVVESVSGQLEVTEKSAGANMSVDVAAGLCLVEITTTLLNTNYTVKTWLQSGAVTNVSVPTADGTHERIDRIVAKFDPTTDPDGTLGNNVSIELVEGTPASSPSAPPTPSNAISLATISVPASDTTISDAQITDDRSYVQFDSSVLQDVARQGLKNSTASASGTDTITATLSPAVSSYSDREIYGFIAANNNTGAVTLNLNGVGAKSIVKYDGSALEANDIRQNDFVLVAYEATNDRFRMLSLPGNPPSAGELNVQAKTAKYNVSSGDSGGVLTSEGGGGKESAVRFVLPPAAAGLQFTFVVAEDEYMTVESQDGDTIHSDTTSYTKGIRANAKHELVHLIAINATDWIARSMVGAWEDITAVAYWIGGDGSTTSVFEWDFGNETSSSSGTTLTAALDNAATSGNNVVGCGIYGTNVAFINLYTEETWTGANSIATSLNYTRGAPNDTYGHAFGGNSPEIDEVHRVAWADEATDVVSNTLNSAYAQGGVVWDDVEAFLANGGLSTSNAMQKWNMATEAGASVTDTLSASLKGQTGHVNNGTTSGYFAGGDPGGGRSTKIEEMVFSTETATSISGTLNAGRQRMGGQFNSTKGYFAGGDDSSNVTQDDIDDVVFATEASSRIADTLGANTRHCHGVNPTMIQ